MDGAPTTSGSGGGGGPAPFLLKTYKMVDDSKTDEIVSWSSNKNSFVVWNPPEFARVLLSTYFKHNNFFSFIRQLNTYIDPEKWEFANDEFIKDQKHLLKNIHRRKPIHSHSNPQGSMVDPERSAYDEEIDRLTREKVALEANISRSKQQRSAAKLQFKDLKQRALVNPTFAEILAQKIESMDFSAYNKKRRLPQVDQSLNVVENSFVDNHSSSRPDFGNVFHQDFSSKLRLELSPAVSDINLVSHSTQSSNEDGESLQRRISGEPKGVQMRTEGFVIPPETLDLSDTGTSFTLQIDSTLSRKVPTNESPSLHPLQLSWTSNEEGDGHISCHLNLTLASSPLQVNKSPYTARLPQLAEETGKSPNSKSNANSKESEFPKSKNLADDTTLFEFIMFILFYFVKLYYVGMANFEFIMLYFVKFTKEFFIFF
ncbi:heat stress transcription factor A-5 [Fagus crenata]